jgi:hypothetical protein
MGTPAYIAPEQARGVADVDIRADIYSLGATLFHLVTGQPPFVSESPITTLIKALNEPMPDPRSLRADISPNTVAIIAHATHKDRTQRYQSAHQFFEDLACQLSQHPLRHATKVAYQGGPPTTVSSTTSVSPTAATMITAPIAESVSSQKPPRLPTPAAKNSPSLPRSPSSATPSAPSPVHLNLNGDQLKALTKRIVTDKISLQAWLILAPGASFPRILLEQVLLAAQITHGIDQTAINEATRVSTMPRRLVLAHGDAPSPGFSGMSVRGETIPALTQPILIQLDEMAMSAVALTEPGQLVTRTQLEPELKRLKIRFGLDVVALHRLVDGPADPQGRILIAAGRPAKAGRSAGFYLASAIENTTIDELALCRHMEPVKPGTILATWQTAVPGIAQMDVLGNSQPLPPLPDIRPEDCAGEGTEVGRDRTGQLVLRATRSGLCQGQGDGSVRIVGALEIPGDLGPDSPPIVSSEIVLVRGNVKSGASITSSSDVVILGNLEDASITVGGSLEVAGDIESGDNEITIGGTLQANAVRVRRIMAGNLKIEGEVRQCQLLASGDIQVGTVIGGSLTAGGTLTIDVAGNKDGVPTELWAGHNLSYEQQGKLFALQAEHLDAERERMISHCKKLSQEAEENQQRSLRMVGAQFVRKDVVENMERQFRDLKDSRKRVSEESEKARKQLATQRDLLSEVKNLSDDATAGIHIGKIAHAGVVVRLADFEPEVLTAPRLRLQVGK